MGSGDLGTRIMSTVFRRAERISSASYPSFTNPLKNRRLFINANNNVVVHRKLSRDMEAVQMDIRDVTTDHDQTPLSGIVEAFEKIADFLKDGKEELRLDRFIEACSLVSVLFGALGLAFKFAELEYVAKVRSLEEASKTFKTLHSILDLDVAKATVRTPGSHSRNLRRVRQGLDLIRALFEQFLSSEYVPWPKKNAMNSLHSGHLNLHQFINQWLRLLKYLNYSITSLLHVVASKPDKLMEIEGKKMERFDVILARTPITLNIIDAVFHLCCVGTRDYYLKDAATTAYSQVCAPYHTWAVRTAVYAGMYALPSRDQLLQKLCETELTAAKKMRRYIDASKPVIEYIDNLYISRNISLDW